MVQQLSLNNTVDSEIGLLPSDWELTSIGEAFELKQGKQLSAKENMEGKLRRPFLRTANVLWGLVDTSKVDSMYFTPGEFKRLILKTGDVLVCEGGDIGRTALWPGGIEEIAYQNHLHRLRRKSSNVEHSFFALWMEYAIKQKGLYISNANRTTIPNLSGSRLKNFVFPLPPPSEQKKIAYVLSVVQEAKEKTEAVIEATKQLKKSLMKYLFTYGPVPVEEAEKVKLKETEIGMVPEEWEVVSVKSVGKTITGSTPSTKNPEYYGSKYMFVSPGDIGEEKHVKKTEKMLSEKGLAVSRVLPKNTIMVVCIGATIGKTAITFTTSCATNQQINSIIPNDDIDSDYLYYALSYRSADLSTLSGRAAIPIVNKSNFETFLLPLPVQHIQVAIGRALSAVDQKLEMEKGKREALESLFRALLSNIMTGRIRVNSLELGL